MLGQSLRDVSPSEDSHPFHIVVELPMRQRLNDRRALTQRAVAVLFREVDRDFEFDLAMLRRGVQQDIGLGQPLLRAEQTSAVDLGDETAAAGHEPFVRPAGEASVKLVRLVVAVFGDSFIELPLRAEDAFGQRLAACASGLLADELDRVGLAHAEQRPQIELAMQLVERAGKHARRRSHGVMPVDLGKHDVPREDHQLGSRLALLSDRQSVAVCVQDERLDQPVLVEVATVRDAAMQAVAFEVIQFVDVDRAGQNRSQQPELRLVAAGDEHIEDFVGADSPVVGEDLRELGAGGQELGGMRFVWGHVGQAEVFDGMTERPMPDVVQQRRDQQQLGMMRIDQLAESLVVAQLREVADRVVKDAEGMLEARVSGSGIDGRSEAQLRDVAQSLKLSGIDEGSDARRKGDILLHRDANDATIGGEARKLGEVVEGGLHGADSSKEFWRAGRRQPSDELEAAVRSGCREVAQSTRADDVGELVCGVAGRLSIVRRLNGRARLLPSRNYELAPTTYAARQEPRPSRNNFIARFEEPPQMTIKELTEEQIRDWSVEQIDRWWLENVYRGDMPQLTWRSAATGFLLGGLLSATNLYIGAKTGWSLGVGITSVILAFAFFKVLQKLGFREFTILENNAMQSIATSAGYMTSPLTSSLAAFMIVNQRLLPWWQILVWNIALSILGVLFAFPMKRRFINDEQHPFPEGQAAGVVMDTLHSSDASVGLFKAKVLAIAAGAAACLKFLQAEALQQLVQGKLLGRATEKVWHLQEDVFSLLHLDDKDLPTLRGVELRELTITPAMDIALIGAGGLMGIRSAMSLLLGAVLNYFWLAPWMIQVGDITMKKGHYGARQITLWSLWPGVAAMVVASFVALLAKPEVFTSAFRNLRRKESAADPLRHIEFPLWISVVGIPVMSLVTAGIAQWFFGIPIWVSIVGLPLTFVLSLVAANSTALTSTTPVGATSKITQLFYGLVSPNDISSNLATASITAEVVSNSSNLLMDIKPGYMLGAKPRQQAIGHIIGIFSGAIFSTFLFFLLFTKGVDPTNPETIAKLQSKEFPMPSVTVWKAVAEVLTKGLSELPESVKMAVAVACVVALILEVTRLLTKNRLPISPIAMGLAFVIDFQSSLCMASGAFLFWLLGVGRVKHEAARGNLWVENHEPICAGVIAGAALMGILDMIVAVL